MGKARRGKGARGGTRTAPGKRTRPPRRSEPPPQQASSPPDTPAVAPSVGAPSAFAGGVTLPILALGLLVGVSYFPALLGGFVWDDRAFTEAAPVREASGLWRIWFAPREIQGEGHYWPLTYTTFWLEHRLWGLAPLGFHAVNLLLHWANAALVWRLLARLAVPGAWVAAAVFAVHPVHVEAVAWVIGRKDLLAVLFYVCAALTWLRFVERPYAKHGPRRYVLALVLFAAGLLCKSIGVTLPAALLIHCWWKQGRVTGTDLLRTVPFFAVGLGIAAADVAYYEEVIDVDYTLVERVLIAAHALWVYVGKLLWPASLVVIYPHWEVHAADPLAWGYVVAAVAAAAAIWMLRRRIGRGPLAGALFFAVTLAPVLGLVEYGYMQFSFVTDRYQYLADVGALAVLVGGAATLCRAATPFRVPAAGSTWPAMVRPLGPGGWSAVGVTAGVLVLLGTLTWRQAGIYRDEPTFFRYVVRHNPTARDAHLNLGKALFESGRAEEALATYHIAVAQRPDSYKAQYSVGLVLAHLGRLAEAEPYLRRTLDLNPHYRDAHFVAGRTLAGLGRPDEAERHYLRALDLDPSYLPTYVNLGAMLVGAQRFADAEPHLRRALEIAPHDAGALQNMALAQFSQQRYAEALDLYRRVVETTPDNAAAHSGMGAALYYLGRIEEALASIDRALALDPTLEEARNNREAIRRAAR